MKTISKSLLTAAILTTAPAMENQPAAWDAVTFSCSSEDHPVTVVIKAQESLTTIKLTVEGKVISVPGEELSGFDHVQLSSTRLLLGEDYYGEIAEDEKPIPHQIIQLKYGPKSSFGEYAVVQFLFHSGSYQFRTSLTQKTANTWEESQKYPGEDPVMLGTTTKPSN